MAHTKREEKYDEHIAPLMSKIIKLCQEHDIPMIASFQLNDDRKNGEDTHEETGEELGPFYCTTRLFAEGDCGEKILKAGAALAPDPPPQWAAYVITDEKVEQVAGSTMPDHENTPLGDYPYK